MARRKSYQKGTVFKRGKKGNGVWVGRWWEYGLARDGAPRRVRRSRVLGRLTELWAAARRIQDEVSQLYRGPVDQ